MGPGIGEVALLGTVQGASEFLPISSSGHLALAELLFDYKSTGLALNMMLHVGTLLAVLVVLRNRMGLAVTDGAKALFHPALFRTTAGGRDALFVLVASLPTAVLGLGLEPALERWARSPLAVGLGFFATAAMLVSTRWARPGQYEVPTLVGAAIIGIAQGLAVMPGVSRTCSTIAMALWLGVRPDRAFELSMLLSVPAVVGAALLESGHLQSGAGVLGPALLGAVVAFAVGVIALLLLRRVVVRGHFSLFALWVLPVAIATLAMAKAWPR